MRASLYSVKYFLINALLDKNFLAAVFDITYNGQVAYIGFVSRRKRLAVNPLLIITILLLIASGVGLIVFILLHSGKGTGISDMIASSIYSTQSGTSIVEKNLDRITVILAAVFLICLIVLMIIYPQGTIA